MRNPAIIPAYTPQRNCHCAGAVCLPCAIKLASSLHSSLGGYLAPSPICWLEIGASRSGNSVEVVLIGYSATDGKFSDLACDKLAKLIGAASVRCPYSQAWKLRINKEYVSAAKQKLEKLGLLGPEVKEFSIKEPS